MTALLRGATAALFFALAALPLAGCQPDDAPVADAPPPPDVVETASGADASGSEVSAPAARS